MALSPLVRGLCSADFFSSVLLEVSMRLLRTAMSRLEVMEVSRSYGWLTITQQRRLALTIPMACTVFISTFVARLADQRGGRSAPEIAAAGAVVGHPRESSVRRALLEIFCLARQFSPAAAQSPPWSPRPAANVASGSTLAAFSP